MFGNTPITALVSFIVLIIFVLASYSSQYQSKNEEVSPIRPIETTTTKAKTSTTKPIATTNTTTASTTSNISSTTQTTTVISTTSTKTETIPVYEIPTVVTSTVQEENPTEGWINFNCTAYCTCTICTNGGGITASGTVPQANWTIAASKNYSFGTLIYIEGYGTYCVEDRGGAITDNKLDIYFGSHKEACNFGRQQLKGYVVRWGYDNGN